MHSFGVVYLLVGIAVGGVVAWMLAKVLTRAESGVFQERLASRDRELEKVTANLAEINKTLATEQSACRAASSDVAGLRAQLESERLATQEKLDVLIAFETRVKENFEALAANALDANSQRLLLLSSQELGKQQADANHQLARKQTAIEEMLKPMSASLNLLSIHSNDLEVKREGAYQMVLTEIRNIHQSHMDLRRETTQLVQALRSPKARGNWGELQLRKCVEFAGMVEYASFDIEKFVRGEEASYRPDLVVKMPNGRSIIVDAKTPLDAFLDASITEDVVLRAAKMESHAGRVRKHLDELSSKKYWRQFVDSPDFIVCFLPSEVLFSAALEQDPSLIQYSASANVLLATPTTLIALLKAVAFGWQQAETAKNVDAIRATALAAYEKLTGLYLDFAKLGEKLKDAGASYDDILTKTEGRGGVFSIARKLKEMGIGEKVLGDGKTPKQIGMTLKPMKAEDWQSSFSLAANSEDNEI